MQYLSSGSLLVAVFVLSYWLTGRVRSYAQHRLLDTPNARSSHVSPTPRGGGMAIVAAFALGLAAAVWLNAADAAIALPLLSGLLVAAIGFWDDHGHVPARWRMLAHLVAAGAALYLVGGLTTLSVNGQNIALGWVGNLIGVVFIAWMLNLVNFMDGIDGIAGSEVLFVSAGAAALSWWFRPDAPVYLVYALLAVAAGGFLVWNWPPAKIFMGDVGSGFLGFMLGAFALVSATRGGLSLVVWLILAGVFIVDASYTLLFRMAAGQRWYDAHRTHAYQKATAVLAGHKRVTQAVLLIDLFWLLPLASAAATWPAVEVWLLILAYLPLLLLAYRLGAGKAG
ncbi:MAG: uncharacterized protein H6R26_872 [Proteobacteria bacterium]|nr:uncharacterized protein [Pseudomonadota bacterium]